jgi:dCMP deaminase
MPSQIKLDLLFMDLATRVSEMSYAVRSKVGAVIVKNDNIISIGWNGTPSGMDNTCEIINVDGSLSTKPEVLHAESNSLMKLARSNESAEGATLYVTMSPCPECAKLIKQARIARVIYRDKYRLPEGILLLQQLGIQVDQLISPSHEAPVPAVDEFAALRRPPPISISDHDRDRGVQVDPPIVPVVDEFAWLKLAGVPSSTEQPRPQRLPPLQPSNRELVSSHSILEAPPMPKAPEPVVQPVSEDEIAAMIAQFETATAPPPKKSLLSDVANDDGVYRSPFQ